MSDEDYKNAALDIHNKFKVDETSIKEDGSILPLKMQKVWSDRMPKATASDYQNIDSFLLKLVEDASYLKSVREVL